jgi:hypothetical protein
MKNTILKLLLFATIAAFSQNNSKQDIDNNINSINEKIKILQSENGKLKKEIGTQTSKLSNTMTKIDSLQKHIEANDKEINETKTNLDSKIENTEMNSNQKFSDIKESLSRKSLFGIIGVLLTIVVSGLLYWLLSKRQKTDKSDVIEQLSNTKSAIEGSLIKEFGKQTELMENQLLLIEQQRTRVSEKPNIEPDHSLALKLASEINLIERNVNLMDVKTKGLKQLNNSIGKLKDNLAANGYEMPVMLGKPFHQGMKVIVTSSIPDENLEKDAEIITKVLIPQVNYNDIMIQTAQIEVSVGY